MRELHERLADAPTFSEYEEIIKSVVGEADLIEFLRLDLGSILRKDPAAKAFQIVRIIAGNPLIMKQMVEYVPDAGSYAPVTILVYEREDGVHLCYDLMESIWPLMRTHGRSKWQWNWIQRSKNCSSGPLPDEVSPGTIATNK
jgi:hypothetical protein